MCGTSPDNYREVRDRDDKYVVPYTSHEITATRLIISAGTYGSPYLLFKNRDNFRNLKAKRTWAESSG